MGTKVLGPWTAGLNLSSNRTQSIYLSDGELGQAENVIYSPEGFLLPRPGCKTLLSNGSVNLYEYMPQGVFSLIGMVDTGANGIWTIIQVTLGTDSYLYKVRDQDKLAGDTNIQLLTHITTGAKFTHLIAHSGFVVAQSIPDPITPTTIYNYPVDTGVFLFTDKDSESYITPLDLNSAVTMIDPALKIPSSHYGLIVKDRLFLFHHNKNRMIWSPALYVLDFREDLAYSPFGNDQVGEEIIEPTTPDDTIKCVEFYNNNFYIFKRAATFMFTYQLSPYTDGYMRKISADQGAYASTIFRENVVVINNKGVFRVDGTEFIDLQTKMNFRFEIPIDHTNITSDDIFITNFNENVLFGLRDRVTDPVVPKYYYYVMNTTTGAWSEWSYDYTPDIAAPASKYFLTQNAGTTTLKMLFLSWDKKKIVFMHWKPHPDLYEYHMDGDTLSTVSNAWFYFPNVGIKTTANVGDSIIRYKKLYRYFLRFYLSEVPIDLAEEPVWTLSINYNDYRFDSTKNPIFGLYPAAQPFPDPRDGMVETAVYTRTYQVRLPQQRVREFVFELKRRFSKIDAAVVIVNPDDDRAIKTGYYWLLSGLWFDYQDKALI